MKFTFENLLVQIRAQDKKIYSRDAFDGYTLEENFSITGRLKSGEKVLLGEYESFEELWDAWRMFIHVAKLGAGIFSFPPRGYYEEEYT